jgi:hypothetical protein
MCLNNTEKNKLEMIYAHDVNNSIQSVITTDDNVQSSIVEDKF